MGHRWVTDVPSPIDVGQDEEHARALLRLLLKKVELYPEEPLGYDTETHGMKMPVKNHFDPDPERRDKPKASDPLHWMQDTVTVWSLAARMDREIMPLWVPYLQEWAPELAGDVEKYGRWCLDSEVLFLFTPLLENPGVKLATWNGKYDAHVSANSGVDIMSAEMWDLKIAGHLYDENLVGKMSLKQRAKDWCGLHMAKYSSLFDDILIDGKKPKEHETSLKDPRMPRDRVVHYASYDAFATLKCWEFLHEELTSTQAKCAYPHFQEDGCRGCEASLRTCESFVIEDEPRYTMWDHYINTEVPYTEVLWRMERRGLHIDKSMLEPVADSIKADIKAVTMDINRMAGRPLNIQSTIQLRQLFFDPEPEGLGLEPIKETGTGAPSTDESVLKVFANNGVEMASLILEARRLHKMLGTYVTSLLAMSELHRDGRIHPQMKQDGARTGRLSTEAPNSQNFPRPDNDEFGIRKMFVAPPGYKLVVGDYGQLEMRIMAHFSQDPGMLEAIRNGMDLHCFTVSLMNNIPYEEVIEAVRVKDSNKDALTDRQKYLLFLRQAAKVIGFGLMYGAGANRTGVALNISVDEAKKKIDEYFAGFPAVEKFIRYTHTDCRRLGYVETLVGRRRHLPEVMHHDRQKRSMAEREAVNSIIQGSAADITKTAMLNIEFDPELNLMGAWLLNQIHDEVVCEVPEEYAAMALPIIRHHMEYPFEGKEALVVPTPTDLHIVDNWAEAK